MVREGAENYLLVCQRTFAHAAAYCHTCDIHTIYTWPKSDATQGCPFGELTPLICIACATICCSVHKSSLTYKEIIFSTLSNQYVLCICICLISCRVRDLRPRCSTRRRVGFSCVILYFTLTAKSIWSQSILIIMINCGIILTEH